MPLTTIAAIKSRDCRVMRLASARSSLRDTELSSSSSSSSVSWCDSEPGHAPVALRDWMYWQRENDANVSCWTKVYAVLRDEIMWLYQREESVSRTLLLQLAVASVEVSGDRELRVVDPNGEDITLCFLSASAFQSWREGLQDAAELTDEYFRSRCLDAKDLPRDSIFRGTLAAYRQLTKRQRCQTAMSKLARRWKRCVQSTASDTSSTL